jgi:hypothetical protein
MKYLINDNVISVILTGKPYLITQDSGFYDQAISAIKNNNEFALRTIVDKIAALKVYIAPVVPSFGVSSYDGVGVEIKGNQVYFAGEVVDNAVTDKIVTFMQKELPFQPLLNFLTKLLNNPSKRSLDSLYKFIEKHNLMIDEDGDVLAWKAVRSNFTDKYSGKLDNSPNKSVKVPRNKVSDDPNYGCHYGLHCGNWNYVTGFATGDDKFVMVKVNPKNVVCIPHDSGYEKMRVCEYFVVQEVNREEVIAFDDSIRVTRSGLFEPVVAPVEDAKVDFADYWGALAGPVKYYEDQIFDKLKPILVQHEIAGTIKFSTPILENNEFMMQDIEDAFGLTIATLEYPDTVRDLVKGIKQNGGRV